MTSNSAQSEDLTQNVFYRLLKYRNSFKNDGKFIYWIYAVARNVFKDQYRKKDPMFNSNELSELATITSDEMNMEEYLESTEEIDLLKMAMKKIDPEKREAIVLSKFQGLKYVEIAAMNNVTENAIKARVRRGLMELRSIMEGTEIK